MQKYMYLTLGLLMISIPAFSADCTGSKGGAGIDVVGVDGYHYCKSKISMNWWSAFAWCEGMGKTLVSVEDCNGIDGTLEPSGSACPNFVGKGTGEAWTSSVPDGRQAYRIIFATGGVVGMDRDNYTSAARYALCK